MRPIIGITMDNKDSRAASGVYESTLAYSRAVSDAGGLPMLLPHEPELAEAYFHRCDGLVFTGGVDPDTRSFGQALHPRARLIDPRRQVFELALLQLARVDANKPVLGVCLGMQLMALLAGGQLDQYLPDVLATAADHTGDRKHPVRVNLSDSVLPQGDYEITSHHQQAVSKAGSLRVIARAHDDVIEAIDDPGRRFYVGVQWHPERGGEGEVNAGLYRRLVAAAAARASATSAPRR